MSICFTAIKRLKSLGLIGIFAGRKEKPDFVFLAHGTELLSTFHLPFGIPSFAAWPYATRWFLWPLWPLTLPILAILWIFGRPFASDKYRLKDLRTETWVVPRFGFQVSFLSILCHAFSQTHMISRVCMLNFCTVFDFMILLCSIFFHSRRSVSTSSSSKLYWKLKGMVLVSSVSEL